MTNKYQAFYQSEETEVKANSSYDAQTKAHHYFSDMFPRRKIKPYEITIILSEKDGTQVVHDPSILG